jgi:hypothetical protein
MLLRRGCVEDDSGRYLVKIRISVVDPDPVGSGTFCRIRIRIRNK